MAQFHNYSPDLIIFTLGPIVVAGYADGTFLTAERDEDAYTKKTGATGDVVRVRSLNRGGSIKVVLQQASITNDELTAQFALDQAFGTFQTLPALVKDLNGTTLLHAADAWIKKLPAVEFGKDLSNREWVVDCAEIDTFVVGGALK